MAQPQTPHVPSCRLKLGIPARLPRVRAENTREISRVHGSEEGRRGREGRIAIAGGETGRDGDDAEGKNQLTNLPGIRHAFRRAGWVSSLPPFPSGDGGGRYHPRRRE